MGIQLKMSMFRRRPPESPPANDNDGSGSEANMQPAASAMSASRNSTAVFRVRVPDHIQPGEEFQVNTGSRIVRVRCPLDCGPGQSLQINVPVDLDPPPYPIGGVGSGGASVTSSTSSNHNNSSRLPQDSPNVKRMDDSNGPPTYMVTIPDNIRSGQQFSVTIQGQQLMIACPPNVRAGMSIRVEPPSPSPASQSSLMGGDASDPEKPQKSILGNRGGEEPTQLFEVDIPPGARPGEPFALMAGGVRVLVNCPPNASPGQRIRFKLPKALTSKPKTTNEAAKIKLNYDKDGWVRSIRATDMFFQWVRVDDKGDVEVNKRFNPDKSAYVRKLEFVPGEDQLVRTGFLSLVPATEAVVDSKIKAGNNRTLVCYSDIANAQVKNFEEKAEWFQDTCAQLCVEWSKGHIRMNVRRQHLLGDSVDAVMSLSRKDLRKLWRFEFIGEVGIDAGGLAREWFQLVTEQIFNPDMGLWQSIAANQMCMQVNPASGVYCEDHLVYFRFLGRVMGKALFDQQLVAGHMAQHIYKHLLGWPITLKDLEMVDEEYYTNLKQLVDMAKKGDDISMLCLDFTTTQEILGSHEEVELIKNGKDVEVTADNLPEYLEACLKYRMLDRVKPQLSELLLGFYDIIPEPLLTVFDFQELELLMCGLPNIDMQDWMDHTNYTGEFDDTGGDHIACHWFWEVVSDFDQEMKARLLQFVTGTSGVPARGFAVLQGNDGDVKQFTIHGVRLEECLYPRAHTCFNRIDLPLYKSRDDLKDKLKLAVTMVATGFDIE